MTPYEFYMSLAKEASAADFVAGAKALFGRNHSPLPGVNPLKANLAAAGGHFGRGLSDVGQGAANTAKNVGGGISNAGKAFAGSEWAKPQGAMAALTIGSALAPAIARGGRALASRFGPRAAEAAVASGGMSPGAKLGLGVGAGALGGFMLGSSSHQ